MKRFNTISLLACTCLIASACNFFSQPVDLQTQSLENQQAATQIADVRATATVNADRMMVTLSGAQTAVGAADEQSTRIVSTLVAQGTLIVDASAITPLAPTDAPQQDNGSPLPQIANPLLTPGAPQVSNQGSAQGDSALVPLTPTALAQGDSSSGGGLTQIELAEQVGSDDCPINPTTSFSSSATDIYVTAVADTPASATLTATFSANGAEVKTYSWQPGFAVHNKCIWFHMPSSDVAFSPGSWAVQLALDGTPVGAPIPFTISDNTPNQINLTPEVGG